MTETQGMLKKHSKESSNLKMSPTSTSKGLAEKAIKLSLEKEKIEDKSSISVPTVDSPIEILENQATVESEIEQNYLNNIQFNFKGEFKLEAPKSKNKFDKESIIKGHVVSISDDFIGIDVGYKSIALIPKEQFVGRGGLLTTEMGKEEEVYIERLEDSDGQIKASKRKFQIVRVWEEVQEAHKKETTIEGIILEKIKGGMKVDVGVNAFLPDSQVDLKPILDLSEVIGKTFEFKVLKYNKKRANIVISRRALLEIDRLEKRAENLKKIKKGNIVKGMVKNITDYGVFVDIGGIDGLLHITDITWARIAHPSEACTIGDEMEVMIIDFDLDKNRVSLGLKQKTKDPWVNIKKYKLRSTVTGKVASITVYGIFVELEKGVEGLVHNTELSWSKKIMSIADVTHKVGDRITAIIKEIDTEKRRISLSVKELAPNPWEIVAKTIKKDSIIEGVIQNVTDFGIFISLVQGVDGLVHISDIDWNNRQQALIDLYKKGQKIRVKVISIDAKAERLALGIKQLKINPWIGIDKKLAAGDLVKGTVRYISEFGLFIETAEGIEGLLHINKMDSSLNSKEQLEKKYTVNDIIAVKILKIEAITQKLAFILPKSKKAKSVTEQGTGADTNTADSVVVSDLKTESTEKTEEKKAESTEKTEEKKAESTEKTAATSLEGNKPAEEKKTEEKKAESTEKTEEKKAESTEKTAATSLEGNKPAEEKKTEEKKAESTEKTAATSLEENKPAEEKKTEEKKAESTEKTAATSLEENKPAEEKKTEEKKTEEKKTESTEKTDAPKNLVENEETTKK